MRNEGLWESHKKNPLSSPFPLPFGSRELSAFSKCTDSQQFYSLVHTNFSKNMPSSQGATCYPVMFPTMYYKAFWQDSSCDTVKKECLELGTIGSHKKKKTFK